MPARLAIDYGCGYTKAVLVWPDGRWTLLGFDGGLALSNAVHVAHGGLAAGAAAWQVAGTDPDGFVAAPLRAGTGEVTAGGVDVEVADLVAASLRLVAAEATRIAGEPVDDVRMVVPAGWGPRRRTWLRRAAGKAGLGQPRLIDAPSSTVASSEADETGHASSVVLVVDVGVGCEVSVLRRDPEGGLEVLSTLADADAGGDRIDAALIAAATGRDVDEWPAGQRWSMVASARVAKSALAVQPAVTMPVPDGTPPVVVNTPLVRQAAQPVLERVGKLAAEAIGNADLAVADVDKVYAVGATMSLPGAAEMIAESLGVVPVVGDRPGVTAVLGAVNASPSAAASPDTGAEGRVRRVPPARRLVGLLLPGVLSLVLYGHFVFAAEFNNGTPTAPRPEYYVLASWGELTVAAVLAVLACLQASALLAVLLDGQAADRRSDPGGPSRISAGIGLAVAAGTAIAGLYAVTAAVFFAQPVAGALRWAVLPVLPVGACAVGLAVIAWRRTVPVGGWDGVLAFPASATVLAAAGILAVSGWWQGHLPPWLAGWTTTLGYAGGVLMGAAVACTLVRHLVARIVLAVLLGFFCLIMSRSGPGILAVLFALAAGSWWGHRAWTVARQRQATYAG